MSEFISQAARRLRTALAAIGGAALVGFRTGIAYLSGTVGARLSETISLKDANFGAVGDGVADDTAALVAFFTFIRNAGGRLHAVIPPGRYKFSPAYGVANAWRQAIEMVDVNDVTITGYGATLVQSVNAGWVVADPANFGNDEGPVQFRATGAATCRRNKVLGLRVEMVKLTYSAGFGDGADFGIALRGARDCLIQDCSVTNAGTDGIYLGASYGNTYPGLNNRVVRCDVDTPNRNGLSIVQNSSARVEGGSYTNASGGTFNAGIDMEPDAPNTQSGVTITGVTISGNAGRGIAAIRTSKVVISGNVISNNAKDISVEGDSSFVSIRANDITCKSVAGLGVDIAGVNCTDISVVGNKITMPGSTNYHIRAGFGGVVGMASINVKDNELVGEGGVYIAAIGGMCDIKGNTHEAKIIGGNTADANVFTWFIAGTNAVVKDNTISIDASITWAGTQNKFQIVNGYAEGNTFRSHAGAICNMFSRTAGFPAQFGFNRWSANFFYDEGLGVNFQIKAPGRGVGWEGDAGPIGGGTYGARIVTGGFARTTTIAANDNQVGDVAYAWAATSGNPIAYRCTVAGVAGTNAGTWVGVVNKT